MHVKIISMTSFHSNSIQNRIKNAHKKTRILWISIDGLISTCKLWNIENKFHHNNKFIERNPHINCHSMLIPESRNCNHLFTLPFCLLSVTTTITTKTQSNKQTNKQKSCTQTVLFDCIIRFFFSYFMQWRLFLTPIYLK